MQFLYHLNLNQNELQNAVIQNLASNPTQNLIPGRVYFNTTDNELRVYNGTEWVSYLDSESHGNEYHIVNFEDSANRGVANGYASLDAFAKIPLEQLPDTTKQRTYVVVDSQEREGLTELLEGDKVFETSTGDAYIWNGTEWLVVSKAKWENINLNWSNINDAPTSSVEAIDAAVQESHNHTNKIVLDNTEKSFTTELKDKLDGIEPGAQVNANITKEEIEAKLTGEITSHSHSANTLKYSQDLGDGVTTSFVVTHNFNTKDIVVMIRENGSPYEVVFADIEITTIDSITVRFAAAPSSNAYRVTII